jgi:hypothetical protein
MEVTDSDVKKLLWKVPEVLVEGIGSDGKILL